MAAIDQHLNLMKGQAECLEEQGHIKEPNEFWAFAELENAIEQLCRVFKENGRNMNE